MAGCAMAQNNLPRRRFMHLIAGAAALPVLLGPSSVPAQPSPPTETAEPTQSERAEMSNLARAFMQRYAMPGLSVAVGRADAILYEDAFGNSRRLSTPLDRDLALTLIIIVCTINSAN
jgi:CubicO group peptidase (beta-lactamase class C family)